MVGFASAVSVVFADTISVVFAVDFTCSVEVNMELTALENK